MADLRFNRSRSPLRSSRHGFSPGAKVAASAAEQATQQLVQEVMREAMGRAQGAAAASAATAAAATGRTEDHWSRAARKQVEQKRAAAATSGFAKHRVATGARPEAATFLRSPCLRSAADYFYFALNITDPRLPAKADV